MTPPPDESGGISKARQSVKIPGLGETKRHYGTNIGGRKILVSESPGDIGLANCEFFKAERTGFEPAVPIRGLRLSKPALSTTQPPLRVVSTPHILKELPPIRKTLSFAAKQAI